MKKKAVPLLLIRDALGLGFLLAAVVCHAETAPPSQVYYIPIPEDQQLQMFDTINAVAEDPLAVFISVAAPVADTVIYYDHWEDGYEADITNPQQATTEVMGDGNPANGYAPGNLSDINPAGMVFALRNFVNSSTLGSVIDYDGRDKIAAFKPISLTKTCFPDGTDTLLAGCLEVFEYGLWGTEYRSPVGVNMPTDTAGIQTYDRNIFDYTAISIMGGPDGATVQIDKDNDGSFEETLVLAEGQSVFRDNVNVGGHVLADNPVQVVLFTGEIGSNYGSRDSFLLPISRWSTDYFCPVSTVTSDGTVTFLYNPDTTNSITVSYSYRNSASSYSTATISVPAGGTARVDMQPANGTTHFGAYRFYTTGANPPLFYALSAVDADGSVGNNRNFDGGLALIGRPSLTTQGLLSLGIGRDPYSSVNPTENGNPVWLTTVGNGHTQTLVYVDYNGDNSGPLTDPNGNQYDVAYNLRELEQQQILDPDGDQSGMLFYSLDPAVRIAAAWSQNPLLASIAQPGIDVASLVPPMREGAAGKSSSLAEDTDGDGYKSAGDVLEYDIRAVNSARTSIPGPFRVQDNLPADVTYVPGTARYRYSAGTGWQAWQSIPDDLTGTPFPLDGAGYSVPGNMAVGQQLEVVFEAQVATYSNLTATTIVNDGSVEISPYGLVVPLRWKDRLLGSIGDYVWNDLDGDGVVDPGEDPLTNITVYADLNTNGVWDVGEPVDTTDGNGEYTLTGLTGGNYLIRVDPADIAAIDVGMGPTYDLDGWATAHQAEVVLSNAQDRVDADFGYRVGASVGDRVWIDRDGDGAQEDGEPGINGVRVFIDLDNDNVYDLNEPNTITFGDGTYYIGNLAPGTYTVRVDTSTLPANATRTYDLDGVLDDEASVTLIAAEHRDDLDFGYRGNLSIGDYVWEDTNGDGVQDADEVYNVYNGRIDVNNSGTSDNGDDGFINGVQIINGYVDINGSGGIGTSDDGTFLGYTIINGGVDINGSGGISNADDGSVIAGVGEAGIPNVRVYIDSDNDGVWDANEASDITDANGGYSIGNLFDGTYTVRVDTNTLPASYIQTYDLTAPSDDDTATVTLSGSSRADVDFGYRNDGTLGDRVWMDLNGDGLQVGEPGIEGILLYIDEDGDNSFDQATEPYAYTDADGYYLFDDLSAGTYNVRVEFSTLPPDYLQTYDLNGGLDNEASRTLGVSEDATDVDFGYRGTAQFGDYIWNDEDGDGVQDGGESGIPDVRVYLDYNGNGEYDSATEPADITDANGGYGFSNLLPGTFTARVDDNTLPVNMVLTYDPLGAADAAATFTLAAGQNRTDIDFGYAGRAILGDRVWYDQDGDGQQDVGEPGLADVTVTLFNATNDVIVGSRLTDANGNYQFSQVFPGTYYLVFDRPAGYLPVAADQGSDETDSDADPSDGRTGNYTLSTGQTNLTVDAGFDLAATLGDRVWLDVDSNGLQDEDESGIYGVIVYLDTDGDGTRDTGEPFDITDSNGNYLFDALNAGVYTVRVDSASLPSGYQLTIANNPSVVPLATGEVRLDVDFGYTGPNPLTIVKTSAAAPGYIYAGETNTYTILVTNTGTVTQTGIRIADTLVGQLAYDPQSTVVTGYKLFAGGSVNVFDAFNTAAYVNNDGSTNWSGSWTESGDEGTATAGRITVTGGQIQFAGADLNDSVQRSVNLSGAVDAVLTVDWSTAGLEETAKIQISSNGTDFVTLLTVGEAAGTGQNGNGSLTNNISAYISAATTVRFLNDYGDWTATADYARFDNVRIAWSSPDVVTAVTNDNIPGGAEADLRDGVPSDLVEDGDGFVLEAGNSMTVTFRAVVTGSLPVGLTEIPNTAGVRSAQSSSWRYSTCADPLEVSAIGDRVWLDENSDGVQDAGEAGIPNVRVELRDAGDVLLAVSYTDSDGGYLFTDLPADDYSVVVDTTTLPSGLTHATYDEDDGTASPDSQTDVALGGSQEHMTADFGYNWNPPTDTDNGTGTAAIGDRVWIDADGDGVQDLNEAGFAGLEVVLFSDPDDDGVYDTPVATNTTDEAGNYIFDGLPPDAYIALRQNKTLPKRI